ncbi:MAG: DNA-binding transcriptional regulator [Verrucomicrobiota bacterium]
MQQYGVRSDSNLIAAGIPKVALLIESSRTYGRGILRGIARYAHVNGPWSIYSQERELHSGIPGWLNQWRGDGIIARIEDPRMANALLRLGHPVVDVLGNNRFKAIPGFDTDACAVAQLAADFFLQAGFGHLAFCGYRGIPFSDRREAAFCARLEKWGLKVRVFSSRLPHYPPHIQAVEQSGLAAEQAIAGWLRQQPWPLGLFACNDVRAQQVLNACREHGVKVPEQVAVMGVDDDDVLCNLCDPPLTSIEPDTERLGFEAARQLDQMMQGKKPEIELVQIPPLRVVERASTDVVPIGDAITVQAMRFIRDHVDDGISVKDVLANAGRSRTDLEQRFRRWLKTSIHGEIIRRRMDRVCSLLRQTDLHLNEITRRAGFSTTAHLCRLFHSRLGQTPTQYRDSHKIKR